MSDLLVAHLFRWRPFRRRGFSRWLSRSWRNLSRWWRWGFRRTTSEYAAFMASPAWRAQRQRVLRRDGYRCRDCLTARAREAHHQWYSRPLMATPDEAIVSLCPDCHLKRHRNRTHSPTSRRLW